MTALAAILSSPVVHEREFVCAELGPHPADANTVSCLNANRDVRLGKKSNAYRGGVADLRVLIVGYANSDALQLDEAQSGAAHPGSFGGTVHNCHRAAIEILPKSEELADSEKPEEQGRQAEETARITCRVMSSFRKFHAVARKTAVAASGANQYAQLVMA